MDRVIIQHHSEDMGGGLRLCESLGVAFQDDMTRSVDYGPAYFAKYVSYRESRRYGDVESVRVELTKRVGLPVVDIGIGCGAFLEACQTAGVQVVGGTDVNPTARDWLRERGLLVESFEKFPPIAVTLWDVLEHFREPHELLDKTRCGDVLLVSLPVYDDLRREVLTSKHYRPDEHYYYFTKHGFIAWIQEYGFSVTEFNEHETHPNCGRQGIGTFVARRVR